MKTERITRRLTIGSIVRKRLADITNYQSLSKWVSVDEKHQPPVPDPTQDLINQLLKEKVRLMKIVEERDKIIALSNNQMRSLKMHCQKLQVQNWQLAQSYTHMLAEVNSGKEKTNALQHEIVCKNALLKAKNVELESKADMANQKLGFQESEKNSAEENLIKARRDNPGSTRCPATSLSMGPTTRQIAKKDKLENRRRCQRRQFARFKSQEKEPEEKLFTIKDETFPGNKQPDNRIQEDGFSVSGSSSVIIKKKETTERKKKEQRSSSERSPSIRKTAGKGDTYKEVALKVKICRKD